MDKTNKEIAEKLYQYSDLLEASGSNPYRVRAYRRAARSVMALSSNLSELLSNENFKLTSIPWIGEGIASVIKQIFFENTLPRLKEQATKNINELPSLPGLGKKRVEILNKKFNIYSAEELLSAFKEGRLNELAWLSQAIIERIKNYLKNPVNPKQFLRLYHALPVVTLLQDRLLSLKEVDFVLCCGDFRRRCEVVEQLHFIICSQQAEGVIEEILNFPQVIHLLSREKNCIKVNLWCGINAIFNFAGLDLLGANLLYATGNSHHLRQLEKLAKEQTFNLNPQGLFKAGKAVAQKTEAEIYKHLNLPYIEPELREGLHEIDAAKTLNLPSLIELADIKGDLHSHTNETDGKESLEAMANAAFERGYEYLAITDHSKRLAMTNGLDEKRLLAQIRQIDRLNHKMNGFLILKSIEVDILEDGSLDLSNNVLKELDVVVCSIHSLFRLNEQKQTERILRAMDNPYFNILGHATGRLIKSRPPYSIDFERIFCAAKENGCFIELNAQPYRLDINDVYCKLAKIRGVKIAISSDAHSTHELNFMQMGIFQGRRGWLEAHDVINSYRWPDLQKLLKRN
ncbi:DNA polymerase/3'-5' exonuclease PolX [Legionella jordanis]|uniref:DNA polymerase/3'-5' exonuclease PolX n=1 Tax=Legionella jordanis TaxID=456 RepID=A0A0W0VDW7_9GAMM|nr:DNA polymerase/3'-5' exonuclease PolX [Legionella jordanis]KTD18311.1 DNA polymerase/3'-5' exonuclease PolX [Legionella jordanis]RMX05229.1 DNA polymerase/3'-5' exonuclease PolX [Legionella jordanis]VEH13344.1 DNA polymerase/3'-5' exonuclease PolX [Legionella jordanis]